MNEIVEFIRNYVEQDAQIPEGEDILTFNFLDNGYIDSMQIFAMMVTIEEKYGIEISDEDMERQELFTIGGLAEYIKSKIGVE